MPEDLLSDNENGNRPSLRKLAHCVRESSQLFSKSKSSSRQVRAIPVAHSLRLYAVEGM